MADYSNGPVRIRHEPSRPESVEAEGTNRFAVFLEALGTAGYVVHLSCAKALERAVAAKSRGVRLWGESVIPHFMLDKTYAERPGVEGMKHVMSPPLRDRSNHKALWDALAGWPGAVGTLRFALIAAPPSDCDAHSILLTAIILY